MALFPFAGNNSIQNVVFALEWADELTTSDLAGILALHSDPGGTVLRKTFPQAQSQRMVMINLNADTGVQTAGTGTNEIGGVNFTRQSPTNIGATSRALNVSKTNCLAIVSDYSRWGAVWKEVREWFSLLAPKLAVTRGITTFGLQYTDVFLWKASPSTFSLSELFSEHSDYLPTNAFKASGLWHSHHGYFVNRDAPIKHDLLENINVNVLDNSGARSIQIITSHKAILASPVWTVDEVMSTLDHVMPDLHSRNKLLLDNLLLDGIKQKIQLNV
jgi:uncharacterized protein (TIGR04255 family)